MTSANASYTTKLKIGDGATTEAFTTIAEVVEIGGVPINLETKDVTNFDSGGWSEKIGTILTMDTIPFKINFLPANSTHDYSNGLIADMVARTLRNFQLELPDGVPTTWTIPALITKFEVTDLTATGGMEADVELTPSGQPTLA